MGPLILLKAFSRHRLVYGNFFGFLVPVLRLVILIGSLVLVGTTAPGVAATPAGKKVDPVELFGLILGAVTALHSLCGFLPGTRVTPVRRLFEVGALLLLLHVVFVIGMHLTPGQLSADYAGPGEKTKDARMYSAYIAAICSAICLCVATPIDLLRRRVSERGSYPDVEKQ